MTDDTRPRATGVARDREPGAGSGAGHGGGTGDGEPHAGARDGENRDDYGIARLVELVRRLRAPDGCPWDRAQTHRSLRRFVLEEAYEVVEAIDAGDPQHLADELGDLLLQVLLHAQIAAESGHFTLADVTRALADKLIRRHPHVFGAATAATAGDVQRLWSELKRQEAAGRRQAGPAGEGGGRPVGESQAGRPAGSALVEAYRVQERAAGLGFDWTDARGARAKLDEELAELDQAVASGDPRQIEEELGDVLFILVNAGRHWGVYAEAALLGAVRKFRRRVRRVEELARQEGRELGELSPAELDRLWERAKSQESSGPRAKNREGFMACPQNNQAESEPTRGEGSVGE